MDKKRVKRLVSIVVPVYGDWASLSDCIDSLKKYVSGEHQVILVNDCGPDVENIEKNILSKIKNVKNFSYHRNESNMGFVQTCNRAVFDIDKTNNDVLLLNSDTVVTEGFLEEMLEVLYMSDRHAITFPRSNNATIATVPLREVDSVNRDDPQYGHRVFKNVKEYLPRYSIVPTGVGFCLLIKRQIIDNFGLFDEIYGLGYHEENDFCQRVNQYGYSVVMSNHSFVYHMESRSFSADKKKKLNIVNEQKLLDRYPYYPSMVKKYFFQDIHPVDHFSDIIANLNAKKKILINLFHFPSAFNGTTKNGHSLLRFLQTADIDKNLEITILAQKEAAAFHDLSSYGFRLVYPETIGDEIYNIGYCPGQIFHVENLLLMNKHCYRNIFSLLDIIALRCNYLHSADFRMKSIFYDSIRLADKIVSISDFTKKDTALYFNDLSERDIAKIKTIYLGFEEHTFGKVNATHTQTSKSTQDLLKGDDYVLVFGNDFKHKAIDRVIAIAKNDENRKYVLLGSHPKHKLPENIVVLPSGSLSDEFLSALIQQSRVVLFASQYEGFGYPILEAAKYNKPLVYFASEVGDEIAKLANNPNTFSFKEFKNLNDVIDLAWNHRPKKSLKGLRTLEDCNRELLSLITSEAHNVKPDVKELESRWNYMSRISEYYHDTGTKKGLLKDRVLKKWQANSPQSYAAIRGMYRTYLK